LQSSQRIQAEQIRIDRKSVKHELIKFKIPISFFKSMENKLLEVNLLESEQSRTDFKQLTFGIQKAGSQISGLKVAKIPRINYG